MSDAVNYLLKITVVVVRYLLTTTVLIFLLPAIVSSQEYSYVHYDVKDGLAGSTVYDITQDKDGFIWFATEAGVSRFDGTHFRNFTTADGLPDTEILKVFADSWGRVWMTSLKNTLYYFYKGKIHTAKNDSFLRKTKPAGYIRAFIEDREKDLYILTGGMEIFCLHTDSAMNTTTERCALTMLPYEAAWGLQENPTGKGILFSSYHHIYSLVNGKVTLWASSKNVDGTKVLFVFPDKHIRSLTCPTKAVYPENFPSAYKNLFLKTFNGAWLLDTLRWEFNKVFLPDKQVTCSFIDKEQNVWFSTYGNGVYKMISEEFRTWTLKSNSNLETFSINKMGDKLVLGSAFNKLFTFSDSKINTLYIKPFKAFGHNSNDVFRFNRLTCMVTLRDGSLLLGFDDTFLKYDNASQELSHSNDPFVSMVKGMDTIDANSTLVGTGRKVYLVNNQTLFHNDTIWPHRSSAVAYYNNEYYIGTPDGLIIITKNKTQRSPGDDYLPLSYRIAGFAEDTYGNLWVATFGGGLVQMKDDKPIRQFTVKDGLSSDICRTLFVQGKFLWVGTDKGISKINISDPSFPMIRYSTDDGLPSDIINAVYTENDSVYVASPAGLTVFNEKKVTTGSFSDLKILEVSVSGRTRWLDSLPYLQYKENSLRFHFVGISFRSGGDILYRYRLKGLNNNWDSTRQTVLEFLSLPSGSYELELIAVNKFGVASSPVNIPFTIATPFWQTLWFKILVVGVIVFLTWWFVTRRFVAIRKREQEKVALHGRMNDLEQLALRAQMNPHFIFNCLNSIQNFIIHNDLETTNQYLTEFAHLIRQTLDNAAKSDISIDKEAQYLTRYLEMERMRFGYTFNYKITVDPLIDQEHTHIPTMILQPYVENSIRHGVRYMENGKGLIEILFEKNNEDLLCIVQDNGIGREKAATLKSQMHVEYQSKGMMLTAERIRVLNRSLPTPVTIEVMDLKDAHGQPGGTRIVIRFPSNSII